MQNNSDRMYVIVNHLSSRGEYVLPESSESNSSENLINEYIDKIFKNVSEITMYL